MTRRLATMCLAIILIGIGSPLVSAQGDDMVNLTLKGISAVWVQVENLPDGAKVLGLTKEMIQTDVELKLRLAGMQVMKQEESRRLKTPGNPHLYILLSVTHSGEAAHVSVELSQNALLERNGEFAPNVTTWDTGYLSANPTAQSIRDVIKDGVDGFLNAWLSVNPKK